MNKQLNEILELKKLCLNTIETHSRSKIVILAERRKIKEMQQRIDKLLEIYFKGTKKQVQ